MNHKLAESYIKDRLRKYYGGKNIFCENGIAYIGAEVEINFYECCIRVFGYRTFASLTMEYPGKDGYDENTLETLVSVIIAFANLEAVYGIYKEVI